MSLSVARQASPVARLPNELLTFIFEDASGKHEPLQQPDWVLSAGTGPTLGYTEHPKWYSVALVCKRWYDVIISSPSLWEDVVIKTNTEWPSLCFDRARRSPRMRVLVEDCTEPIMLYILWLFCGEPNRVRKLALHEAPIGVRRILPMIIGSQESTLEELRVTGVSDYEIPHDRRGDLGLTDCYIGPAVLPQLRSLMLMNTSLMWADSLNTMKHLRTFYYVEDAYEEPPTHISLDEFLLVLKEAAAMEEIYFMWGFPWAIDLEDDDRVQGAEENQDRWTDHSDTYVDMPRLRTLHLSEVPEGHALPFLSRLHLSSTTDVQLKFDIGPSGTSRLDTLLDIVPQDVACLPILGIATEATFSITHFSCGMISPARTSTRQGLTADFEIMSSNTGHSDWDNDTWEYMQTWLEQCITLTCHAPLRKVYIEIESDTTLEQWVTFAEAFPSLETLTVVDGTRHDRGSEELRLREDRPYYILGLFFVLSGQYNDGVLVSADYPELMARRPDDMLPNLRHLKVKHLKWHPNEKRLSVLYHLLECLKERVSLGMRLAIAEIEFTQRPALYDFGGEAGMRQRAIDGERDDILQRLRSECVADRVQYRELCNDFGWREVVAYDVSL